MGREGRLGEAGEKRCRQSSSEEQGVPPTGRWAGQGPGEPSLNLRDSTTFLALDTLSCSSWEIQNLNNLQGPFEHELVMFLDRRFFIFL